MPPTSTSGVDLLDQLEAYVHAFKAWPADKNLELRERIEQVERLAVALCNSSNETEQNGHRRQLGILLCGWPE